MTLLLNIDDIIVASVSRKLIGGDQGLIANALLMKRIVEMGSHWIGVELKLR
jgi:hypothetical protein